MSLQTRSSGPGSHPGGTFLAGVPHAVGEIDSAELFGRWQRHHDQSAQEELVTRFLPLARKLARRYAGPVEPFEDLVQVASLGLVKAVDRFDPDRGIAFASYAVPTILGELKRYFRDFGWAVHVPRGAQELALKVEAAQARLLSSMGRSPTIEELAGHLQLSVDRVLDALEAAAAHHGVSLDAPGADEEGESRTLGDLLGEDDESFELIDARLSFEAAAPRLPVSERRVLALRFGEDLTQTQIATLLGVSQMQVSRILRRALARLDELINEPDGVKVRPDAA